MGKAWLYPKGTKMIPWWAKVDMAFKAVTSCPPPWVPVEIKTPAYFPERAPSLLPLAGEVSVTSRDTEEEGIVVLQFRGGNNGVVRLGGSVHLSKNFLGESLRNPEERRDCKY
jgi:hypothetical protein